MGKSESERFQSEHDYGIILWHPIKTISVHGGESESEHHNAVVLCYSVYTIPVA